MSSSASIFTVGAIAIVRASQAEVAVAQAETIVTAGLSVIEVSLVTPGALALIERLTKLPGVIAGVGTALSTDQVRAAYDAGAQFVVSPNTDPMVISLTKNLGMTSVPGVSSGTEVAVAIASGADILKLFPASTYGPSHLRALRDPFPDQKWAPTGGVQVETIQDWWAAGARIFGLGSALSTGGLAQIPTNVIRFLSVIQACRSVDGDQR